MVSKLALALLAGGAAVTAAITVPAFLKSQAQCGLFSIRVHVIDATTQQGIAGVVVTANQGLYSPSPATTDASGYANFSGLCSGGVDFSYNPPQSSGYTATTSQSIITQNGQIFTQSLSQTGTCQCPTCACGYTCDSSSCPNCHPQIFSALNAYANLPEQTLSWQFNKYIDLLTYHSQDVTAVLEDGSGNPIVNDCTKNCPSPSNCTMVQWVVPILVGQMVDIHGNGMGNAKVNLGLVFPNNDAIITPSAAWPNVQGTQIYIGLVDQWTFTDCNGYYYANIAFTIDQPTGDTLGISALACLLCQAAQYVQPIQILSSYSGSPQRTSNITFNHWFAAKVWCF